VSEVVTLPNGSSDSWSEVVFNISAAHWPGIFSLSGTEVEIDGEVLQVTTSLENTMLHVPLSRSLAPGEIVAIRFDFMLQLPVLDSVGWGPTGNAGWGPGIIQMGDFYPALVPYVSGSGWLTWRFRPVGDPVISEVADFDVTVTAPPGVTLAAAGFVSKTESEHHYHLGRARAFAFLASPDYVRQDEVANGVPIQVYVRSAQQHLAAVVLREASNALRLFEEWYGPYPYSELVIAQNGFLTSHEYSGFISMGDFLFETYNGEPDSLLVAITAHEVAHQWWYGAVGNDQVNEPWLDEGMAMLSELLFYERYYPSLAEERWWEFRVDRWNPTGDVDATIYEYNDSPTFVHNMYGRAAHFIQDLRSTMGETAFQAFLRDYYQRNLHKVTTTQSFTSLAQLHSPVDLTSLIDRYFGR
jgi:hypothetical protein